MGDNAQENRKKKKMAYKENKEFLDKHPEAKSAIEDWCKKQTLANKRSTGGDSWYLVVDEYECSAYVTFGWDRFLPSLIDLERLYNEVVLKPFKRVPYIEEAEFELKYSFMR